MKHIKKFFWRIGMTYQILKEGYEGNILKAWDWTKDEEWILYYEDFNMSPKEAMLEDMREGWCGE